MAKCICRYTESDTCNICNGTGIDNRKWYLLVGWSEDIPTGYYKFTSDWNMVNHHISEGMELYGYANSQLGVRKLADEFYDNGGWFYR